MKQFILLFLFLNSVAFGQTICDQLELTLGNNSVTYTSPAKYNGEFVPIQYFQVLRNGVMNYYVSLIVQTSKPISATSGAIMFGEYEWVPASVDVAYEKLGNTIYTLMVFPIDEDLVGFILDNGIKGIRIDNHVERISADYSNVFQKYILCTILKFKYYYEG